MWARTFMLLVVLLLAAAPRCLAEQPDWDELADQLLVIRFDQQPSDLQYTGLWSFDPDTEIWRRLRYFEFNGDPIYGGSGYGSFLTAGGGLVWFKAWPYELALEPGSFRIVRRTTPIPDPAGIGWAVQGPQITAELAATLGLEPGTYGFAECLLDDLTSGWGSAGTHYCSEYQPPGADGSVRCTPYRPWPLLRRIEDGEAEVVGLLPAYDFSPGTPSSTPVPPTLSLDPQRKLLWRGTPNGVELIPIGDGGLGQPVDAFTFDFPPFDEPETQVWSMFFHPRRRQLFLWADTEFPPYPVFLALDESLQVVANLTWADTSTYLGRPVAMTALGEPPSVHEQLLPIVVDAPGLGGTHWTSELWLFNPSDLPTTVTLRRVVAPEVEREVDLGGHASVKIGDALAFMGGGPTGDGTTHDALVATTPWRWGEQVVAASRASTPAPGGGSFGHAVTAAPSHVGYSNHLVYEGDPEPDWYCYSMAYSLAPLAAPAELLLDLREQDRFRHNLGIVNDSDQPVNLTLLWGFAECAESWGVWDVEGRPESALQTLSVPPHSVRVVDLVGLFPPEVSEVWPPRVAVWGDRPAALWLSMVDNLTGDATFSPFATLDWYADLRDGALAVVPVVAHGPGEAGTAWLTDLYNNPSVITPVPRAFLHPADRASDCGGAALSGEIWQELQGVIPLWSWPSDRYGPWYTVFPDVARLFEACSGEDDLRAGLEVYTGTWMSAWTRTYTTRADGGTYGDMLPLYPLGGWPVQHFAGVEVGPGWRVNVGLFNGDHDHAITHVVTLYSADGAQAAQRTITLEPLASFQRRLEHLFLKQVGELPAGSYGMTVLPLDDDEAGVEGRCWAWVSLVDNVTGDPTNWW